MVRIHARPLLVTRVANLKTVESIELGPDGWEITADKPSGSRFGLLYRTPVGGLEIVTEDGRRPVDAATAAISYNRGQMIELTHDRGSEIDSEENH